MLMAYPATLTSGPDGTAMVQFPDVPEAFTVLDDAQDLQEQGSDALSVALSGYLDAGRAIPRPSKAKRGQELVYLPVLAGAKLAIHDAMISRGMSRVELASRLQCDEKMVRRLLDLDHKSQMSQIEAALKVLGKAIATDVRDLALA